MTDPTILRREAADAAATAQRCRLLAADLDLRVRLLSERTDAVRARHTPDVWQSDAATRSRDRLVSSVQPALWAVRSDVTATARRLIDAAVDLETDSRALLDQAWDLELELLRSELEPGAPDGADSIAVDVGDPAIGDALPSLHPRPR